ncbi:hypothetical protein ACVWZA_001843 [Sphingomonas sp. UYAg733]
MVVTTRFTQNATEPTPGTGLISNIIGKGDENGIINVTNREPAIRRSSVYAHAEFALDVLNGGDFISITAKT